MADKDAHIAVKDLTLARSGCWRRLSIWVHIEHIPAILKVSDSWAYKVRPKNSRAEINRYG